MCVRKENTLKMGNMLVGYAVSILEQLARGKGHIAGCNCIFLETMTVHPIPAVV